MIGFQHAQSSEQRRVVVRLVVALFFQETIVFLEFSLTFLLLRAKVPDAVLKLSYGHFHILEIFLRLLHSLFDLSEIGHQLRIYVPADIVPPKLS